MTLCVDSKRFNKYQVSISKLFLALFCFGFGSFSVPAQILALELGCTVLQFRYDTRYCKLSMEPFDKGDDIWFFSEG